MTTTPSDPTPPADSPSGAPTPPPPGGYQPPAAPGAPGGYGAPPAGGYAPAPVAAGQLSVQDERMWAMLSQVGGIVLGFIAPLVVMLIQGEKSAFTKRASIESLNFQITLIIAYVVCGILSFVLIGLLLIPIVWIGSVILMILAGVANNRGEDYRYPFTLRLVK